MSVIIFGDELRRSVVNFDYPTYEKLGSFIPVRLGWYQKRKDCSADDATQLSGATLTIHIRASIAIKSLLGKPCFWFIPEIHKMKILII